MWQSCKILRKFDIVDDTSLTAKTRIIRRLKIQKLKRQIKEMEQGKQDGEDAAQGSAQIKQELEEIKKQKEQLRNDYSNVQQERDRLREELAQIRNGIPDSLLNQTQTIMAFKSRILDLEKESAFLKDSTLKLEADVVQGTRSVTKDSTSLQAFEKEHSKIQDRLNRLEDITKMQLHDINRMLVEANYLHGISSDNTDPDRPKFSE